MVGMEGVEPPRLTALEPDEIVFYMTKAINSAIIAKITHIIDSELLDFL